MLMHSVPFLLLSRPFSIYRPERFRHISFMVEPTVFLARSKFSAEVLQTLTLVPIRLPKSL